MTTEQPEDTGEDTTWEFDLREAFQGKQDALYAKLGVTRGFTNHPTTVGDATEADWVAMLREFLPSRYGVGPVGVVDSLGATSDQIDVAIYDTQYSPLFFETAGGVRIVPSESIYAVFEVKQRVNKGLADYSGDKIASVRVLKRTSVEIPHAGPEPFPPKDPADKPMIGGILCQHSGWKDMDGKAAVAALTGLQDDRRIDIGCVLDGLSFEVTTDGALVYSDDQNQLIYFVLRLYDRLRALGTVLALDLNAYAGDITKPST